MGYRSDRRRGQKSSVVAPRRRRRKGTQYVAAADGTRTRDLRRDRTAEPVALRAYLRFAGAERLDWGSHLAAEERLFLTRV